MQRRGLKFEKNLLPKGKSQQGSDIHELKYVPDGALLCCVPKH